MGGKQSLQSGSEMICPKCPLTPIISLSLNSESVLTCEYRCPFMHFGHIPFEDITKDKENKHGVFCDRCDSQKNADIEEEKESKEGKEKKQKEKKEEKQKKDKKNIIEEELLYCGTCKQFICQKCRSSHEKEKESHKTLVEKSKIRYTCLEHGENYSGFCFTCLISVCKNCKRHNNHHTKKFEDFYPEKEFLDKYKYYMDDYDNYISSFRRHKGMNKEHFNRFKERNSLLLNLCKYLKSNFEENKKKNTLNGEIIINYLNVVNFNYKSETYDTNEAFVKYCKTHLILANKPISDICTFSKTKADFNISKLDLEEFIRPESKEIPPKYFKYSPIGKHIVYCSGPCVYFLSTTKEKNENKGFKIRFDKHITSFNIINKNILCICCDKIYFYLLSKNAPFYNEYKDLPTLEIFTDPAQEIEGDIDNNMVVRTNKELLVINDKKKKGKYEIVARTGLENINRSIKEKREVPDDSRRYYYYYNNENRTKIIEVDVMYVTKLKSVFDNYIVTIEKGKITTRQINDLKVIKTIYKNNTDCLVFNGNVIAPDGKNILFYTLPNLENVSCLSVSDDILSLNIINRRTFIVIQSKYIEQFEANTWKRLWREISFGDIVKSFSDLLVIGAYKELFLFSKEKNIIYKAIPKIEK